MPAFLGVPVDAAYHLVSALAGVLAPLPGGLAAAAAIVLFTVAVRLLVLPLSYRAQRGMEAQARMAPRAQALRRQLAGQPDRLRRELSVLYESEGSSLFAGCLPLLVQWPFLSVVYLLFRSPTIGGAPNSLLTHDLFGAPLGSHWLGGAGPLSAQGAVFAGLFVLLAVVGWLSARVARRFPAVGSTVGVGSAEPVRPGHQAGQCRSGEPAGQDRGEAPRAPGALARLLPYLTVVVAAFVPLAAGLYLVTTTAWTLAERGLLRWARTGSADAGRNREGAGHHP
jgi:YidC/Oxa1 family membrane protein insertase